MWQLVINGPGYFDTPYELREGTTHIGRADENDIVLSGDLVSRKHARLIVQGALVTFEDLGSRNGTRLNGQAFTGVGEAKAGDMLGVGENTLLLRQPTQVENAVTELADGSSQGVRRFGRGLDIGPSVILAKDVRDSVVLRVLDNAAPFELGAGPPVAEPLAATPSETPARRSLALEPPSEPVAWQSLVTMYKVAGHLAAATALTPFLEQTCDLLMRRVGATTGVVLLRHRNGVLVPAAVRHGRMLRQGEVPVSEAIIDAALSQGRALVVADVKDDERFAGRESVMRYDAEQVICVPIGSTAPYSALLYLNRPSASKEPVEALLDICTAIGQLLATAIERFTGEREQEDRMRRSLERFHPSSTVERRLAELKGVTSHLSERTVAVLVCEVPDLEQVKTRLGAQLASVLSELSRIGQRLVFSFGGSLHHLHGAQLRAVFEAPTHTAERSDFAVRAVRCAMAIRIEWERALSKHGGDAWGVKAGIDSGHAMVGTLSAESRIDFCVLGAPAVIAPLVCAHANPSQLLITRDVLASMSARFDATPMGERTFVGSKHRTALFEVIQEDNNVNTVSSTKRPPTKRKRQ